MKKILLIAALFVTTLGASAQTEKGTWLVGTDVAGLNYGFDSELFTVDVTPKAGYFVSNNWAIGGQARLNIWAPSEGDAETGWAIGPFARGYFGKQEKGKFFGQLDVVFGDTFAQTNLGAYDFGDETGWNLGLTLGYAWFLNKNTALELGLGYDYTDSFQENTDGFSDLGLKLGFQIHLPGKKK